MMATRELKEHSVEHSGIRVQCVQVYLDYSALVFTHDSLLSCFQPKGFSLVLINTSISCVLVTARLFQRSGGILDLCCTKKTEVKKKKKGAGGECRCMYSGKCIHLCL